MTILVNHLAYKMRYNFLISPFFITGHASKLYDTNNPDWAPSLLLGYGTSSPTTPASQKSRYERSIIRSGKKQLYSTATTLIDFHNQTIAEHHAENCSDSGISCQTDMGGVDIDEREKYITVLNTEIQNLRTEVMDLRNKITNFSLSPDSFQNNEEKVKFYTGLPNFLTLMAIFDLIKDHLNDSSRSMLTPFQQMMVCLMKIRLNLSHLDLAYRYGVSCSTVTRVFSSTINVMASRFKPLICWPSREELRKTMPMDFRKHFGTKVAVIIDCFEVFVERPSNL